jgi:hypothetical protein
LQGINEPALLGIGDFFHLVIDRQPRLWHPGFAHGVIAIIPVEQAALRPAL